MKLNFKEKGLGDGLVMQVRSGSNGAVEINTYTNGYITMSTQLRKDVAAGELLRMMEDLGLDWSDISADVSLTTKKSDSGDDIAEALIDKV